MAATQNFEGWIAKDKAAADGNMVWEAFEPKTWQETDVEIEISHCGVCGTDIHTLRSGWGPADYPLCVGHEIVGRAVRVGAAVPASAGLRVGDVVGVGAQSWACQEASCVECAGGHTPICRRSVSTYNGRYADGSKSTGGYGRRARVPAAFVFRIPDAIPPARAAPMLCAGVTMFTPLRERGCGPDTAVGIVGIGGLGHFGLMFAKALGAKKVVAISRSSAKKADALKLGADGFIATGEDPAWAKKNRGTLDLIICTVGDANMPLSGYMRLLRSFGHFVTVGAPDDDLPPINAFSLLNGHKSISGSMIGGPATIRDMLQVAAEKQIMPWVEERPMEDANQVIVDMEAGKPRYRYVLVNKQ